MILTPEQRGLVRYAAMLFAEQGDVVIPIDVGTKRPYMALLPVDPETGKPSWELLVKSPLTAERVAKMFDRAPSLEAFALATGVNGRFVIDFDKDGFHKRWRAAVGELADGLTVERSGRVPEGIHVHVAVDDPPGNLKLAHYPDAEAKEGRKCAIETRGAGGYLIVAPSAHKSGRCYELLEGELDHAKLKRVSTAHLNALLDAARALCECPFTKQQQEVAERAKREKEERRREREASGEPSVIDEFNRRHGIVDTLLANGYRRGPNNMLVRPGKDDPFASSVQIHDDNTSYHHSTNDPLHDKKTHDPFDVYCLYQHNGDVSAAVKAAAEEMGMAHPSGGGAKQRERQDQWETTRQPRQPKQRDEEDEPLPPLPMPRPVGAMLADRKPLNPVLVEGFLREGEILNLISTSKARKTFLLIAFLICLATGRPWLGRFVTRRGRVLLIDNELHEATLTNRIAEVASAMGVMRDELADSFHVLNLRGNLRDIYQMDAYFRQFPAGHYQCVAIDALYRVLPEGLDENDNGAMAHVFNALDRYAALMGAAFVCVHHASKGSQADKAVTDVGSGAGAMARAVDTHLVIRRHKEHDAAIVEAAARSFPPTEPFCIQWTHPTWWPAEHLNPADYFRPTSKAAKELPKVDPVREAEEARRKAGPTPEEFVAQFVTAEPRPRETILAMAVTQGFLKKAKAKLLLLAAVEQGFAHLWRGHSSVPDRYANRPENLADTVSDDAHGENNGNANGRKGLRRKIA